jgi:membrane-bound lytic murein transglycosylase B
MSIVLTVALLPAFAFDVGNRASLSAAGVFWFNTRSLPALRLLSSGFAAIVIVACSTSSGEPIAPVAVAPTATSEPAVAIEPSPAPAASPEAASRWLEPPVAAEEPSLLAEQITAAERAVRDLAVTGPELAWMAQLQQAAYRQLAQRPEWREAVLASLPDDVRPAAQRNVDAALSLRAMITPGDALPPWRIVEPAPMEELFAHYREAEAEFGVPWSYLAAIHLVETVMGRIRGTSVAGAQGPMQFMPATWAAFGEGDINDTSDAIRAAARYLVANGAPGNMANAVFRYNPSQRYVQAVTAYAEVMSSVPGAYRGYYHWQVYFLTTRGDVLMPVGYSN